jgi:serine-type D-Ala-D-Ala carboxypeptidase/endopeptidase (penicillin-binding protein 4)
MNIYSRLRQPISSNRSHQTNSFQRRKQFAMFAITGVMGLIVFNSSHAQRTRAPQPSGSLASNIGKLLDHPDVREAHWGVSVVSVKKGQVLAAVDSEKLFIPASTAKLYPAAAALSLLGPDYQYHTSVYGVKHSDPISVKFTSTYSASDSVSVADSKLDGDLVIVGRGDPNLSGRVLPFNKETERDLGPIAAYRGLAAAIAAEGVRVVTGNLIADDSFFVHQPYGTGWEHDDLSWLSAAPASALAINDNVLFLSLFPAAPGAPAIVQELPMPGFYEVENRTLTIPRNTSGPNGSRRRAHRSLGVAREPGTMRLELWGEIPDGAAESSYAVSIEDPPRFAAQYLRRELEALGVKISGEIKVKRLEPRDVDDLAGVPVTTNPSADSSVAKPLAEHVSLPLRESLRATLKVSQNLHAEMLLRTLGKERRGVGSAEAGIAAIDDFLNANHISTRGVALRDGSGLSRQNMVSPAAMTALLKHMQLSEQGAAWTAMLSEAGVDGTLRTRLRGRYTTGRVWGKTGSLQGVAALAGYVRNQSNDLLAFAIFANNYNGNDGSVISVIDQIVTMLARSR